jgi:hypothetical protein
MAESFILASFGNIDPGQGLIDACIGRLRDMSKPHDPAPAKEGEQSADQSAERRRIIADYVESLRELIGKLRGKLQ